MRSLYVLSLHLSFHCLWIYAAQCQSVTAPGLSCQQLDGDVTCTTDRNISIPLGSRYVVESGLQLQGNTTEAGITFQHGKNPVFVLKPGKEPRSSSTVAAPYNYTLQLGLEKNVMG